MGTLGFEPRSAGLFLEATRLNRPKLSSLPRFSVTHRSKTGASHSSQVILCPLNHKNISKNLKMLCLFRFFTNFLFVLFLPNQNNQQHNQN